jgi:hypothetical protein
MFQANLKNRLLKSMNLNLTKVLISLAIFVQIFILVQITIKPVAVEILSVRAYPARDRSAKIGFGEEIADYITFINDNTSEDDFVLIPPRVTHDVLGHVGLMQYYMMPRRISNCAPGQSFAECFLVQGGPNTIILAVNDFPPIGIDDELYQFLPFGSAWGVYVPNTDE